jgi:tol-pal system protein YbgF
MPMKIRLSQGWFAAVLACSAMTLALPASAGMFDDEEARRAIVDLREKFNAFQATAAQRIDQNTRASQDLHNQVEQLRSEVARLRGDNEILQNEVQTLQRQAKDYYKDLNDRVARFEPQKVAVEGQEGMSQPGEKEAYDGALKQFRDGDFKGAGSAFAGFIQKYPQSPYTPLSQFWMGTALYAQRDYKGSTTVLQNMVQAYPNHAKVPDAMIAIANNQIESGQKAAGRRTLEQVASKYAGSPAAKAASDRLKSLK